MKIGGIDLSRSWPALAGIGAIIAVLAAAFAWADGLLGQRVTNMTFLEDTQHDFPAGYRRAHGKGVCFEGVFRSSGAVAKYSYARVFTQPETRAIGRFSIGNMSPYAADNSTSTISMAMMLTADNGQQWRMKMNNEPYFATRDAPGFLAMLKATAPDPSTGKPAPEHVAAFLADYPEARKYMDADAVKPWASSFAGATFYAIHAYFLLAEDGRRQAMRWSLRPHATFTSWSDEERAGASHDALFKDVAQRLTEAPLYWDMVMQLAAPGDPVDDPSQPWPESRQQLVAGTLEVQRVFDQTDGVCRDINFDPTLIPAGMALSNDPVLATRAGIYAHSYNSRLHEIGYGMATDAVGKKAAQ
ncbi:catalase family peroxidase [Pseudomonas syringae]|jgi:catalase|uniref:catalase family peroxidase n=1 Tax=Pseudomonas syringae TaxID=317 RepID=UPI000E327B6A|nr:catalase family peroxidase [Pseudomonas syringae]